MNNSYQRIDRISEEVRREVDKIIREELHDPRIMGTYSVTRAEVTRDLRHAKVYVSVLEDECREDLIKALKNASGYIRRSLGHNMLIRYSPELHFVSDENIAYGVHVAQLLQEARINENPVEEETNEDEAAL